jgi:hypothetical protein
LFNFKVAGTTVEHTEAEAHFLGKLVKMQEQQNDQIQLIDSWQEVTTQLT